MLATLTLTDLVKNSMGLVRVSVVTPNIRAVAAIPRSYEGVTLRFRDHLVTVTQVLHRKGSEVVEDSEAFIRTVHADSEARFTAGEDALVFLAPPVLRAFDFRVRVQKPAWERLLTFRVFGGFQGKFTIINEEGISPFLIRPGLSPTTFERLAEELLETFREESEEQIKKVAWQIRNRLTSTKREVSAQSDQHAIEE
ncbi:MAG: hypothetical protein ABI158_02855 [Edaphobacter sp.]